jgi:hypothetical protein
MTSMREKFSRKLSRKSFDRVFRILKRENPSWEGVRPVSILKAIARELGVATPHLKDTVERLRLLESYCEHVGIPVENLSDRIEERVTPLLKKHECTVQRRSAKAARSKEAAARLKALGIKAKAQMVRREVARQAREAAGPKLRKMPNLTYKKNLTTRQDVFEQEQRRSAALADRKDTVDPARPGPQE